MSSSEGNGLEHAHEETNELNLPDMMTEPNAEGQHAPTEAAER